jgi:cobalt-zinc-cadmium efflux system protein
VAHDHAHEHFEPRDYGRSFAIGVALNFSFVVVEAVGGFAARSTAMLADAAHNASDVLGLLLSWGAIALAQRRPSARRTYGMRRGTILAALANALLLLVAVGAVAWEAIMRLRHPQAPQPTIMMIIAATGIVVNGGAAALFTHASERDVNVRSAFLHLLTDAIISAGVVLAGAIIFFTGATWVDPVTSLAVCVSVVIGVRTLLRESLDLALDTVPPHIRPEDVRKYLEALPGVARVHDLHIWPMSTTHVALTAHLVMPESHDCDFLHRVAHELHDKFEIDHATLQVEPSDSECHLEPEEII